MKNSNKYILVGASLLVASFVFFYVSECNLQIVIKHRSSPLKFSLSYTEGKSKKFTFS